MTDMHPDDRPKVIGGVLLGGPLVCWIAAAAWIRHQAEVEGTKVNLLLLARDTVHGRAPLLIASALAGLAVAITGLVLAQRLTADPAGGAPFRRHLRGTRVVRPSELARSASERGTDQVTLAGVPIPTAVETLHLLVAGSTGSGKSVALRELALSALMRGDRIVVADPNGDMLSKFWRPGDVILNPHDARGEGWSVFNEIRRDFDFQRYSLSLVPRGKTKEAEEWNSYGRLLLCETARKLALIGQPSIKELHRWTTIAHPDDLKKFLAGTAAESLFVGAEKALASARFVLSSKLASHLQMPAGTFSLRDWLERPDGGSLFITWREDMAESLKPLISAWIDTICTSVLSLDEDPSRRLWMFVDELASLDKLPSLIDAATKGRKAGLRLVAGIQSTAQLDDIYGRDEAQALRSCFRSLLALGGAKTDPKTCEELSKALGEREVERDHYSTTRGLKSNSAGTQIQRVREPVVLPSDIASLPDLTGFLAFAGDHPIARVTLQYARYMQHTPPFEERTC
jgi:hypothetical protein